MVTGEEVEAKPEAQGDDEEVETSLTVEADGRKASVTVMGPRWAVEAMVATVDGDAEAVDAVTVEDD